MKILAVDTSTTSGSLALLEDETIIAEWTVRSAQTHNRRLLKSIDLLLCEAGWNIEAIDGYAVVSGPGSFTGLRIGMTTLKVLAWTRGKLYAAIPSLDALAQPFSFSDRPVCAMLDARKKEIFCALYQPDRKGGLRVIMPYTVISPSALADKIDREVIFCGDAWPLYKNQIKRKLGAMAVGAPPSFHLIRAGFVGELARRRFVAGQADEPATSVPLYVRASEAEIRYPHFAEKSGAEPEII
ncbi:MAG: tRNA (adenosine(37)-N6)-threonylcarbamoyltransferase complex dimerization subunit type 1 TsaB [Syntrophobacteraceae bacterium]